MNGTVFAPWVLIVTDYDRRYVLGASADQHWSGPAQAHLKSAGAALRQTHASGNVTDSLPAFLASRASEPAWPGDLPGGRDKWGRCQESEFCSCRDEPAVTSDGYTGALAPFIPLYNVSESTAAMYYLLGLPENVFFYFIVFHFILLSLNLGFIFVIFVYLSFNFIRRGGFKGDGRNLSDWVTMTRTLPKLLIL